MDTRPDRAGIERRLCESIERGWTLQGLAAEPGFPSRQTVWRWSRKSPRLAQALAAARGWRRAIRKEAEAGPCFSQAQAEVLLARLRRGASLGELRRTPGFPDRRRLARWRRERPDFAADLAVALRVSRRLRDGLRGVYDEPAADRVICALNAGARMAEVVGAPGLPRARVVAGWRRRRPDFDHAVRMALLAGRRRRAAQARGAAAPGLVAPALAARVRRRIAAGATLDELAGSGGLPHRATLHRWMRRDPAFAQVVREACAMRDAPLADEVLALAETATPETLADARRRVAEIKQALGRRGVGRRR
jgi:hypothetical protein